MRRLLRVLGWLGAVLLVAVGVLVLILWHSPPTGGVPGPQADALAHSIEQAVNADAWAKTGAVRWTYSAGNFHHLWDRKRNLARVAWGDHLVLLDVAKQTGRAYTAGQEVTGDEKTKLLAKGYSRFLNDSFWLNPLPKLFDEGVTRSIVDFQGKPALYVQYSSGGLTPGDSYLWILGDDHRPIAWRMFVHILKIRGVQATWEAWTPLPTGALVATVHKMLGIPTVKILDLAGAPTLADLETPDPFARLR